MSIEQLHVGIGSTNSLVQKWDYEWNQITFLTFVKWLDFEEGLRSIDLWRTDLDSLDASNGTAPWIYDGLHQFLQNNN